jgi:hypothetical protein
VEPGSGAAVWRQEVDRLMPARRAFDGFVDEIKRVSPTCLVHFRRNRYSVPASFTNRPVSLRIYPNRILVVAESAIVCEHQRVIERSHHWQGRTVYNGRHYLAVVQRKPGALRNGAPFAELPEAFRQLQHDEQAVLVTVEMALQAGISTKTHIILNLLHWLTDGAASQVPSIEVPQALSPKPTSPATTACARGWGAAMRHDPAAAAITIMLHSLKMHGMAQAAAKLAEQSAPAFQNAIPILSQLLKAEITERKIRSIAYKLKAARFPIYKDLTGFDFASSQLNEALVRQLHAGAFMDSADNIVLVGKPGTGKIHVATALGVQAVEHHRKRVRFFSMVELVNALEQKKVAGKAGQIAARLLHTDLLILGPAVQSLEGKHAAVSPAQQAL